MLMEDIINTIEGQIMKLRALGFSQADIASRLGMSQSAVSQRLELINRRAQKEDVNKLFWSLLLGAGAAWLFVKLLKSMESE